MENLNVLDKGVVQSRLSKYFDSFREERINGVAFNIMPAKEDVPLIKQVSYDKTKDIFEVVFEYKSKINLKQQGNIIFIEDTESRLVGIQVIKLRENDIAAITLQIITTLDRVIQAARVELETHPNSKEIAKIDLEERKADFFKDIVKKELPNLVA